MANVTITDLTAATALDGTELFEIEQGGNSRKVTRSNLSLGGALVYNSSNLTGINASSGYFVPFNSEEYDDGNYHSTSTNTDRLTVTAAGRYRATAAVEFNNGTVGDYVRALVSKNGATFGYQGRPFAYSEEGQTIGSIMLVSAPMVLAANDYLSLWVDTLTDTSIDLLSGGTWLAIERLS